MQACFEAGFGIPHDALRDVLAQQHQDEPVSSTDLVGVIIREICESDPAEGPESVSIGLKALELILQQCLVADPAEVEHHIERRIELAGQKSELYRQINKLRAQLAEAHALLSKAHKDMEDTIGQSWCISCHQGPEDDGVITHDPSCTFCAMEVAMSASAEPIAPVEIDERAELEAYCTKVGLPLDRLPSGEYLIPATRFVSQGWHAHARAALERKQ